MEMMKAMMISDLSSEVVGVRSRFSSADVLQSRGGCDLSSGGGGGVIGGQWWLQVIPEEGHPSEDSVGCLCFPRRDNYRDMSDFPSVTTRHYHLSPFLYLLSYFDFDIIIRSYSMKSRITHSRSSRAFMSLTEPAI